jgi:hypothetical protein
VAEGEIDDVRCSVIVLESLRVEDTVASREADRDGVFDLEGVSLLTESDDVAEAVLVLTSLRDAVAEWRFSVRDSVCVSDSDSESVRDLVSVGEADGAVRDFVYVKVSVVVSDRDDVSVSVPVLVLLRPFVTVAVAVVVPWSVRDKCVAESVSDKERESVALWGAVRVSDSVSVAVGDGDRDEVAVFTLDAVTLIDSVDVLEGVWDSFLRWFSLHDAVGDPVVKEPDGTVLDTVRVPEELFVGREGVKREGVGEADEVAPRESVAENVVEKEMVGVEVSVGLLLLVTVSVPATVSLRFESERDSVRLSDAVEEELGLRVRVALHVRLSLESDAVTVAFSEGETERVVSDDWLNDGSAVVVADRDGVSLGELVWSFDSVPPDTESDGVRVSENVCVTDNVTEGLSENVAVRDTVAVAVLVRVSSALGVGLAVVVASLVEVSVVDFEEVIDRESLHDSVAVCNSLLLSEFDGETVNDGDLLSVG